MFLYSLLLGTKVRRWERLGWFGINNRGERDWRRWLRLIGGRRTATKKSRRGRRIARQHIIGAIPTSGRLAKRCDCCRRGKLWRGFRGRRNSGRERWEIAVCWRRRGRLMRRKI